MGLVGVLGVAGVDWGGGRIGVTGPFVIEVDGV